MIAAIVKVLISASPNNKKRAESNIEIMAASKPAIEIRPLASETGRHARSFKRAVCELLHPGPGGCLLWWGCHRAIGDGGRSPTAAPLGRFLPRLGPVGCRRRGLFPWANGFGSRLVMPGLDTASRVYPTCGA